MGTLDNPIGINPVAIIGIAITIIIIIIGLIVITKVLIRTLMIILIIIIFKVRIQMGMDPIKIIPHPGGRSPQNMMNLIINSSKELSNSGVKSARDGPFIALKDTSPKSSLLENGKKEITQMRILLIMMTQMRIIITVLLKIIVAILF